MYITVLYIKSASLRPAIFVKYRQSSSQFNECLNIREINFVDVLIEQVCLARGDQSDNVVDSQITLVPPTPPQQEFVTRCPTSILQYNWLHAQDNTCLSVLIVVDSLQKINSEQVMFSRGVFDLLADTVGFGTVKCTV